MNPLYCPYCGREIPPQGSYEATKTKVRQHIQRKHAEKKVTR